MAERRKTDPQDDGPKIAKTSSEAILCEDNRREAMVATRRQAGDALDLKRGVFKLTSAENRGILKRSPSIARAASRRLSLGAVDADVLYQPCGEDASEDATRAAGAREGGTEAPVRAGVSR